VQYRNSDESDFDWDESDIDEEEVAWAQCDHCDKWRKFEVKDESAKFSCSMVGNGVSCSTPGDDEEDQAKIQETKCDADAIHVFAPDTPVEVNIPIGEGLTMQVPDGKDDAAACIRDSPHRDVCFDPSSELVTVDHYKQDESMPKRRRRNTQLCETDLALREIFGDHDFQEFQHAVEQQRVAVQQQRIAGRPQRRITNLSAWDDPL
jgi:hypothetical protein